MLGNKNPGILLFKFWGDSNTGNLQQDLIQKKNSSDQPLISLQTTSQGSPTSLKRGKIFLHGNLPFSTSELLFHMAWMPVIWVAIPNNRSLILTGLSLNFQKEILAFFIANEKVPQWEKIFPSWFNLNVAQEAPTEAALSLPNPSLQKCRSITLYSKVASPPLWKNNRRDNAQQNDVPTPN